MNSLRGRWRLTIAGVLIVLVSGWVSAEARTVAVISSDSLTSSRRTVSGVRQVLKRSHPGLEVREFLCTSNESEQAVADSIRSLNPILLLTVGSRATAFAQTEFPNKPIVFSAVLYPAISGFVETMVQPGRKTTGASLNVSAQTQFLYFQQLVPGLKRIGVLYTENTAPLIAASKVYADREGLTLVPIKITDERQIAGAIDSLCGSVDGVWSVADPRLFTPQATRFILMRMVKKGIPFMGFSRHVVASGALFALDFDYKAIGRQAGRIASRVLNGENPGSIPVSEPDVIWFHYNEKTAELIGVKVPERLAAVAKEVYR